jgi:transposase-like protein
VKKNHKAKYATVECAEGVNYREIADMMTEIGFKMNHSSARNYVLRVMRKFADAIISEWDLDVPSEKMDGIIKSVHFQQAVSDILQQIKRK